MTRMRLNRPPARPPRTAQIGSASQARAERNTRIGGAEISIIADDAERGEAGGDDRAEDEAAGPRLEGAAQFLDAEDDAGERRIEGRGNARRGAREQKPALIFGSAAAHRIHQRGADLHGRAFATDRGAA